MVALCSGLGLTADLLGTNCAIYNRIIGRSSLAVACLLVLLYCCTGCMLIVNRNDNCCFRNLGITNGTSDYRIILTDGNAGCGNFIFLDLGAFLMAGLGNGDFSLVISALQRVHFTTES